MILDNLYKDVSTRFRGEPIDTRLQEKVESYIKSQYPGNYVVEVAEDLVFSIIFNTEEDLTLFILQCS